MRSTMADCGGVSRRVGSHTQTASVQEMCTERRNEINVLQQLSSSQYSQPVPKLVFSHFRNFSAPVVQMSSVPSYSSLPMQDEPLDLSMKRSSTQEQEYAALPVWNGSLKSASDCQSQNVAPLIQNRPETDTSIHMHSWRSELTNPESDETQEQLALHQNQVAGVCGQCHAGKDVDKEQTEQKDGSQFAGSSSSKVRFQKCSRRFDSKTHHSVDLEDKLYVDSALRKSLTSWNCRNPSRRLPIQKVLQQQICDVCDKSFSKVSHLQVHSLVHSSLKPHSCKECSKSFAEKGNLSRHMLIHLGLKPHSCKDCGKSFADRSNLSRHMLIHSGLKPHSCKVCGKSFALKSNLSRHMLTHSGLKPHSCKDCGKSFARKSDLSRHMLTHSGLKPHPFKQYCQSFARKDGLSKHMLTHSALKP